MTMNTLLRRVPPALLVVTLAGCANPLTSDETDYGRRVSLSTLRNVEPLDLSTHALPPREQPEPYHPSFEGLEKIELSLPEARALAFENNLDLAASLVAPEIANTSVTEEEAAFESVFGLSARWNETDDATSSQLTSAQSRFQTLAPSVTVPLRTGGTATISLPMTRNKNDNPFTTLNPAYTSDLQFSLSHALLRGAGRRAATYAVRVASYNEQISESETKLQVIAQLSAVDRAFWRLYQARAELDVQQQQLELAQAQLERAQRQEKAGRVPEVEVVRAQAGVASRLEGIITAENTVRQQQRELKRVLNAPDLRLDTDTLVIPSSPPDPVEYDLDADALADAAVDNRMELLEDELRLAIDASTIEFNENQALPQVNLDALYRLNGLGGSLDKSFDTMSRNRFTDWQLGLSASVPIGNEAAESRLRRSVLTRLQRLRTRDARRLTIRQQVYDAVDALRAGWQRIMAAQQSVVLNTRTFEAEQRQFDVGRSTSNDVLDAATRLADAQLAEIRAIVDYQIAQTDLAAATGTLLGKSRVRWEPEDPRDGDESAFAPLDAIEPADQPASAGG